MVSPRLHAYRRTDREAPLFGRRSECAALAGLVAGARAGGQILVVRGEAGIGKTTLLDYVGVRPAAASRGLPVLRARWTCVRRTAPICGPFLDRSIVAGTATQRAQHCLRSHRRGPDASWSGSRRRPHAYRVESAVCLIDDAQWLDQVCAGSCLVARRLVAADAVVAAIRSQAMNVTSLACRRSRSRGLGVDAGQLLDSVVSGPMIRASEIESSPRPAATPCSARAAPCLDDCRACVWIRAVGPLISRMRRV
jgi:hypothetical protein